MKKILEEFEASIIDIDDVVESLRGDSRYRTVADVVDLIHKLLDNRRCIECKTLMSDEDIIDAIPPVREDPVRIIIHECPKCGFQCGKQYLLGNGDDEWEG